MDPFPRQAASLWDDQEREEFIDFIAHHYEIGEEIPGTGGLRKVRWSRRGMGKRGGTRVIYYYYDRSVPVFLFTVYAKASKEDLSAAEKSLFRKRLEILKAEL